jgi:hypothetical protein
MELPEGKWKYWKAKRKCRNGARHKKASAITRYRG